MSISKTQETKPEGNNERSSLGLKRKSNLWTTANKGEYDDIEDITNEETYKVQGSKTDVSKINDDVYASLSET